jgi:hypothetical protein
MAASLLLGKVFFGVAVKPDNFEDFLALGSARPDAAEYVAEIGTGNTQLFGKFSIRNPLCQQRRPNRDAKSAVFCVHFLSPFSRI